MNIYSKYIFSPMTIILPNFCNKILYVIKYFINIIICNNIFIIIYKLIIYIYMCVFVCVPAIYIYIYIYIYSYS